MSDNAGQIISTFVSATVSATVCFSFRTSVSANISALAHFLLSALFLYRFCVIISRNALFAFRTYSLIPAFWSAKWTASVAFTFYTAISARWFLQTFLHWRNFLQRCHFGVRRLVAAFGWLTIRCQSGNLFPHSKITYVPLSALVCASALFSATSYLHIVL